MAKEEAPQGILCREHRRRGMFFDGIFFQIFGARKGGGGRDLLSHFHHHHPTPLLLTPWIFKQPISIPLFIQRAAFFFASRQLWSAGDVRECRDGRASIMRSITSSHGCYEKRGIGGGKWGVADILLEGRGKKPSFTLMGNRIDARLWRRGGGKTSEPHWSNSSFGNRRLNLKDFEKYLNEVSTWTSCVLLLLLLFIVSSFFSKRLSSSFHHHPSLSQNGK